MNIGINRIQDLVAQLDNRAGTNLCSTRVEIDAEIEKLYANSHGASIFELKAYSNAYSADCITVSPSQRSALNTAFLAGWKAAERYFSGQPDENGWHYLQSQGLPFSCEQTTIPLEITDAYVSTLHKGIVTIASNRKTGLHRVQYYTYNSSGTRLVQSTTRGLFKNGVVKASLTLERALGVAGGILNKPITTDDLVPVRYWSNKYGAYIYTDLSEPTLFWYVSRPGAKLSVEQHWISNTAKVTKTIFQFKTAEQALAALDSQTR